MEEKAALEGCCPIKEDTHQHIDSVKTIPRDQYHYKIHISCTGQLCNLYPFRFIDLLVSLTSFPLRKSSGIDHKSKFYIFLNVPIDTIINKSKDTFLFAHFLLIRLHPSI